jgi:hypothetical protein
MNGWKLILFGLFFSLRLFSQQVVVNNTNLHGFTSYSLWGVANKTNTPNGVDIYSQQIGGGILDTVIGNGCFDSIKVSCIVWRTPAYLPQLMFTKLNGSPIPTSPTNYTYTYYNTNTVSFSYTVGDIGCLGTIHIYIENLSIQGYQSPQMPCTQPPNIPSPIQGATVVCPSSVHFYSVSPLCSVNNYSWILPNGWTGTSQTSAITVTAGLAAGTISVCALNGCGSSPVQTLAVSMSSVLPMPGTISGPSIVCAGTGNQMFSVTPVPGATSYSWTVPQGWLAGGNGNSVFVISSAGNITIGVQASNMCTISPMQTISISIIPLPIVTVNGNNSICTGNSTTLTASGATNYTWNPGPLSSSIVITPTATTTYSVIGETQGCTNTTTVAATVNQLPIITIAGSNTVCAGGPLQLAASGASTYSWSNGSIGPNVLLYPQVNATYSLLAWSAANCSNTVYYSVTVVPVPTINISTSNSLICSGQSVTLSASGANSYVWSSGQNTQSIIVSPVTNTVYPVAGMDQNGCTGSAAISQSVAICTEITNRDAENILKIFPNPFQNEFLIISNEECQIKIFNSKGELILYGGMKEKSELIDLSGYSPGVYFLELISSSNRVTKKIVRE